MLNKLDGMLIKAMEEAQEIGAQLYHVKGKELRALIEKNLRLMGRIKTLEEVIQLQQNETFIQS